jgi:hypothetical protein
MQGAPALFLSVYVNRDVWHAFILPRLAGPDLAHLACMNKRLYRVISESAPYLKWRRENAALILDNAMRIGDDASVEALLNKAVAYEAVMSAMKHNRADWAAVAMRYVCWNNFEIRHINEYFGRDVSGFQEGDMPAFRMTNSNAYDDKWHVLYPNIVQTMSKRRFELAALLVDKHETSRHFDWVSIAIASGRYGDTVMAERCFLNHLDFFTTVFTAALEYDNKTMVQWCAERDNATVNVFGVINALVGEEYYDYVIDEYIDLFEPLKTLIEHNPDHDWDTENVFEHAVRTGNVPLAQWSYNKVIVGWINMNHVIRNCIRQDYEHKEMIGLLQHILSDDRCETEGKREYLGRILNEAAERIATRKRQKT